MGLFLSRTDRFNVVDMMVVVRDLNLTLRRAFIFLEDRFSVFLHTVKDQRKRRWFLIVLLFFIYSCCFGHKPFRFYVAVWTVMEPPAALFVGFSVATGLLDHT